MKKVIERNQKIIKIQPSNLNNNKTIQKSSNLLYSLSILIFKNKEELVTYYNSSSLDKKFFNFIKINSFSFKEEETYQKCTISYELALHGLSNIYDENEKTLLPLSFEFEQQDEYQNPKTNTLLQKSQLMFI